MEEDTDVTEDAGRLSEVSWVCVFTDIHTAVTAQAKETLETLK